jgi:hypothetical protein
MGTGFSASAIADALKVQMNLRKQRRAAVVATLRVRARVYRLRAKKIPARAISRGFCAPVMRQYLSTIAVDNCVQSLYIVHVSKLPVTSFATLLIF